MKPLINPSNFDSNGKYKPINGVGKGKDKKKKPHTNELKKKSMYLSNSLSYLSLNSPNIVNDCGRIRTDDEDIIGRKGKDRIPLGIEEEEIYNNLPNKKFFTLKKLLKYYNTNLIYGLNINNILINKLKYGNNKLKNFNKIKFINIFLLNFNNIIIILLLILLIFKLFYYYYNNFILYYTINFYNSFISVFKSSKSSIISSTSSSIISNSNFGISYIMSIITSNILALSNNIYNLDYSPSSSSTYNINEDNSLINPSILYYFFVKDVFLFYLFIFCLLLKSYFQYYYINNRINYILMKYSSNIDEISSTSNAISSHIPSQSLLSTSNSYLKKVKVLRNNCYMNHSVFTSSPYTNSNLIEIDPDELIVGDIIILKVSIYQI